MEEENMVFKIESKKNENGLVLNSNKDCLKTVCNSALNEGKFEVFIDEVSLNLGQCLYGKNKKESKQIQKENCKKVLKIFAICRKFVAFCLRHKLDFSGKFYVENLENKKNNNDFLITSLLELKFNTKHSKRLQRSYELSCDFLDMENSLNKMCDFHDNLRTKHRDLKIDKISGCCPPFCKERVVGEPCKHKNLSCKIFMCKYLEDKGYYFTPFYIPMLVKHMNPFQRFCCLGIICRTEKKALNYLKRIKALSYCFDFLFFAIIVLLILPLFIF